MRMKGKIAAYSDDVNAGTIIGTDNRTYIFSLKSWAGAGEPVAGLDVSFVIEGDRAVSVTV